MQVQSGAEACGEVSMFESVRTEGQKDTMRYLTSLLISIVVHTAVLSALLLVPLLFFDVVQAEELIAFLIEPPTIPPLPPVPIAPSAPRERSGVAVIRGEINPIPEHPPVGVHPEDDSATAFEIAGMVRGIGPGTESAGPRGDILSHLLEATRQPALPTIQPPIRRTPVRVSGPLQEGKLIQKVSPIYPELAIRAHVSGTVLLEAIIDEEGNVTELKVVDGPPLLRDAACTAVKQWKYLPTMVGSEPVPVMATVSVIFRFR
jgi:periplasmic protein TonB